MGSAILAKKQKFPKYALGAPKSTQTQTPSVSQATAVKQVAQVRPFSKRGESVFMAFFIGPAFPRKKVLFMGFWERVRILGTPHENICVVRSQRTGGRAGGRARNWGLTLS